MRSLILAVLLGSTVLTVGCAAHVGYTEPSGSAELVYAGPGVQVIADYNEPVFYTDGFYWRLYGGGWYRSSYYTGGWVYASPPAAVLRIDRPYTYAHYRPHGWVAGRGRAAPAPRYAGPSTAPGWRGNATAPPPSSSPGWRGNAAPPPARAVPAPPPSGWRGRSPNAPQPAAPAPAPGWRGGGRDHRNDRH